MVKVFQVYYDDKSKGNLLTAKNETFIPFFNPTLTKWYETDVIVRLLEDPSYYAGAEWLGIVSHKFLRSRAKGTFDYPIEQFQYYISNSGADVCTFFKSFRNGRMFSGREQKAYEAVFNTCMEHIGFKYREPKQIRGNVIFQNHFIARVPIYEAYYKECLLPVMRFIDDYKPAAGIMTYRGATMHPFICEKLMQAYVIEKKLLLKSF